MSKLSIRVDELCSRGLSVGEAISSAIAEQNEPVRSWREANDGTNRIVEVTP